MRVFKLMLVFLAITLFTEKSMAQLPPPLDLDLPKDPYEVFDNKCFLYETVAKKDSGILLTKHRLKVSSAYNAMITIEQTFIESKYAAPFLNNDSIVLVLTDGIEAIKKHARSYFLSTQLKYIDGKPEIKSNKLNFKSADNEVNKNFIINFKDDKKEQLESIQETDNNQVWAVGECSAAAISIGF